MGAGYPYFNCSNKRANLSLEQVLREMVKADSEGNPIISLNPNSTLEDWYTCENSKNVSLEQLAKRLIVEDENGKPAWKVTNE